MSILSRLILSSILFVKVFAVTGHVVDELGVPVENAEVTTSTRVGTEYSDQSGFFDILTNDPIVLNQSINNSLFDLQDKQIELNLSEASKVSFDVFNIKGVLKYSFNANYIPEGKRRINLPSDLPLGVYYIRLSINGTKYVISFSTFSNFSSIQYTPSVLALSAGELGIISVSKQGYLSTSKKFYNDDEDLGSLVLKSEDALPANDFYRLKILDIGTKIPNNVEVLFQVKDYNFRGVTGYRDCDVSTPLLCDITVDGNALTSESKLNIERTESFTDSMFTVLLLDNSSSLQNSGLVALKSAAKSFVRNIAENQYVAVYSFATNTVLEVDFTSDTTALINAIDGIALATSSTNLYGSLITGLGRIRNQISLNQKTVVFGNVIVFTDGEDTQGSSTLSQVISQSANKDIYAIGYGQDFNPKVLDSISRGRYYTATDVATLEKTFDQIKDDLLKEANSFYYLYYKSPKRGNSNHSLELFSPVNTNTGSDAIASATFNSASFQDGYAAIADSVTIKYANDSLYGSYNYNDTLDGDAQGNSRFRWFINGIRQTQFDSLLVIPFDSTKSGTLYEFEVMPRQKYATPIDGTPVRDTLKVGTAPTIINLKINNASGNTILEGDTLRISYTYKDVDGDLESVTTFQWYRDYVDIAGAVDTLYIPTILDSGKIIGVSVVPQSEYAIPYIGNTVSTSKSVVGFKPPVVSNVKIIGTATQDSTLVGSYSYSDIDGDIEGISTYQWYRSGVAIDGANDISYEVQYADSGKVLSLGVLPVSLTGTNNLGVEVISLPSDTVKGFQAPVVSNVTILGTTFDGDTLKCDYVFSDADGDQEGISKYQWYRNSVPIVGAIDSIYKLQYADSGSTISVGVIPIALTGSNLIGLEFKSTDVSVIGFKPPYVLGVSISGDAIEGGTLTGHYTYKDIDADKEGQSIYQWTRSGVVIEGATELTYSLSIQDAGNIIGFSVIPVSLTGTPSVGIKTTVTKKVIGFKSPVASDLSISGNPSEGGVLTATYIYSDVDGDLEGNSEFQWYRNNKIIVGENSLSYNIQYADSGTVLKFSVTPKAISGSYLTGTKVFKTIKVNDPVKLEDLNSTNLSNSGTNYVNFVFDGDIPYAAFADASRSNKATLKKLNGSVWETIGSAGFSSSSVTYLKLAFNEGVPYVAFGDNSNGHKLTVMKYNGETWEVIGAPGFSAGQAVEISLVFYDGTPYVAYRDLSGYEAKVMKYNGVSWEVLGSSVFTATYNSYTNLAINEGFPYVVYRNPTGYKATMKRFNGSWESVGSSSGFSDGWVQDLNLTFNNGVPYVAFSDNSNGYKLTVMKYNGMDWEVVGLPGFSPAAGYNSCLSFNSGIPFVAFRDASKNTSITMMKFNGATWEVVGSQGFVSDYLGNLNFAFNSGVAYVAYKNTSSKAKVIKLNRAWNQP